MRWGCKIPTLSTTRYPRGPYSWLADSDFVGCRGAHSIRGMAEIIVGEYNTDVMSAIFGGYDEIPFIHLEGVPTPAQEIHIVDCLEQELEKRSVQAYIVPTALLYRESWDGAYVKTYDDMRILPGRGYVKILGCYS